MPSHRVLRRRESKAAVSTALFPALGRARELVATNRSWETDYAGYFFGLQRQKNIAHTEADAAVLAEHAKGLAAQLADLETRRAGLEKDVLAFLQPMDTGGTFRDLGVPLRRPPTFAPDGKANELSFWSIRAATATWSGKHVLDAMNLDDPMCFDGVEYFLGGNWPLESAGKPKPFDKDRLDAFRQLMQRGYAVKPGPHLQIHTRGSMVAPLSSCLRMSSKTRTSI